MQGKQILWDREVYAEMKQTKDRSVDESENAIAKDRTCISD